ncbi:hypothetical protein GEMRC1_000411 [Eukaryota sp. GEM-RC1]
MTTNLSTVLSPFLVEFQLESIVQLSAEIDVDAILVEFNSEAASAFSLLASRAVNLIVTQIGTQYLKQFALLIRLAKKFVVKAPKYAENLKLSS